MRLSPLVKKVFSNNQVEIETVTKQELERSIKTKKVLVDVNAITKAFQFFTSKGYNEGICLLRGRYCAEYLLVSDVFLCHKAKATSTHVKIPSESYTKASEINDGNYTCGWGHSHPGFKTFISKTDEATQKDFQAFFPDAVALVMNPYAKNGIEFKFFRYEDSDKHPNEIKYDYLVNRNEE